MRRPITGFGVDDAGDPFAVLSCGHRQHVRHNPPFANRPWVLSEAGRHEKLGQALNCLRCDRFELPEHYACHRSTPVFDQDCVPAGLLHAHTTKAGVWARIVVEKGLLRYHVDGVDAPVALTRGSPGIVPPEVPHRVEFPGPARFRVEFWREP